MPFLPRNSRTINNTFRRWTEDPILGPFMSATPQVLNLLEFVDRASEQLLVKRANLNTLQDYESYYIDELNFIKVLRQSVNRLPPCVGTNFAITHNLGDLEEGKNVEESWINWYSHERSEIAPLLGVVEDGLEAYPEFCVIRISGEYPHWRVRTNIEVHELKYRVRQAFEFFRMLHRIFCSPVSAPPPGEELPFGPENLNPDLLICPRVQSGCYWFDRGLTLREACEKVTSIFLVATIRDKVYPRYLPPLPPLEGELPPWHLLSQTVD